jgi:hypothetical protein
MCDVIQHSHSAGRRQAHARAAALGRNQRRWPALDAVATYAVCVMRARVSSVCVRRHAAGLRGSRAQAHHQRRGVGGARLRAAVRDALASFQGPMDCVRRVHVAAVITLCVCVGARVFGQRNDAAPDCRVVPREGHQRRRHHDRSVRQGMMIWLL